MGRPRPETLAAVLNGLVVLVLPLALMAWVDLSRQASTSTHVTVRPPGTSVAGGEIDRLQQPAVVLLPFAALAVWRTRVYAQRVVARVSRGWAAVGEAGACAFGMMFLLSAPRVRQMDLSMSADALAYFICAVALGVLVGLVLRTIALLVLRLRTSTATAPALP